MVIIHIRCEGEAST